MSASADLRRAFEPAHLSKLALKNRLLKAATFEGKTPGGVPGDDLLAFHRPVAEGGIAMTTLGYCTIEADGRINDQQLYMHEGIREPLSHIVRTLQEAGTRVSGQMTHCGNFSENRSLKRLKRPLGPSRQLNMLGVPAGIPFAGAMTHRDIDELVNLYRSAARFMKDVGFDAVEVHFGHGYALSQFISPFTNKRTDEYGGSLTNRMRLPIRALEAVREGVGDEFPILGKMGLTDGIRQGLQEDEAIEVAARLDDAGIDALITSGGTSSMNVMKMFRGPSIGDGLIEQASNPIARLGLKMVADKQFRHYPYEELYFLDGCKRVRDRVKNAQMVYIGGCSTLESIERVMREGIDFIQLGRPLIADPAFVNNAWQAITSGHAYDSGCTHCNRCVSLINAPGGVRCVLSEQSTRD